MNLVMRSISMSSGSYEKARMLISSSSLNCMGMGLGKKSWRASGVVVIEMRDKGKNRKPLQKGRNLSIEAIQTIQALKRPKSSSDQFQVLHSKFRRLLKLDMMAVLRELLRQDQSLLALLVFEEIQKEYWYKPQVSLYAEIISALARNGLFDKVDMLFLQLQTEKDGLEANTEGFNVLLETLMSFDITRLAMECFEFMKSVGCEPDRSTFKLLVNHLDSKGETTLSASIRQEAQKYYGDSLEFLDSQAMS